MSKSSLTMARKWMTVSSTGGLYSKSEEKQRSWFDMQNYRSEIDTDAHLISLKELCAKLRTDAEKGLSQRNADRLLILNGPNSLTPPPTESRVHLYCKSMFSGFLPIFWIGSLMEILALCLAKSDHKEFPKLYTALILIVAAISTGTLSYLVETRNIKTMDGFKRLLPRFANVIRDGKTIKIPIEEIVVGDLVYVQAGDCLPADIRLTECHNLKVDNSNLTGECEILARSLTATHLNPLETENLAFSSSLVYEGYGQGIVFACGDETSFGKIANLTTCVKKEDTSVRKEIKEFNQKMSYFSFTIAFLGFIIAKACGAGFMYSIMLFIGLVLANIPLGLQIAFTGCLSLISKRMLKRNCFIKNLDSIETLGATNIICVDQTGTITENKLKVVHAWFNDALHNVEDRNRFEFNTKDPTFEKLLFAGILSRSTPSNLNVSIEKKETGTEMSIINFAQTIFDSIYTQNFLKDYTNKYQEVFSVPAVKSFDCHLVVYFNIESHQHCIVMRGAPEIVLKRCNSIQVAEEKLTDADHIKELQNDVNNIAVQLQSTGERVIAFCMCDLDRVKFPKNYPFSIDPLNFPITTMTFIGLLSMIDPIRPNVSEAVAKCRLAGVQVVLVTGDHPITAVSIARKVGIISDCNETVYEVALRSGQPIHVIQMAYENKCKAVVVTGDELRRMATLELENVIETYSEIIFARTSPQQKLLIVEAFQRRGNIVVATGDGINDSPALKKADIGIALGQSGSDISKDAASIILVDDNFSSIVYGIAEGRLLFDNLKKIITYTLTSNIAELLPFLAFALFKIPLPLTILAILVVDIGMELWPALSLAYEYPESDLMMQNPRNVKKDPLISAQLLTMSYYQMGVVNCVAGFTSYFMIMYENGFCPADLLYIQPKWASPVINDLKDSHGQEWTYQNRMSLQSYAVSAFLVAILETQWSDLLISKTRRLSLFQHGMRNWCLNFGMLFETLFICFACYTSIGSKIFGFAPVSWKYWVLPLFFSLYILIFDEIRKLIIRKNPKGFIEKYTYY